MSRPTIHDIARLAGVSTGTVSRVINGHSTVALRTRQQVEQIMRSVNYAPDPAARQLSWRTGHTVGLSTMAGDPLLSPYQVLFRRSLEARTSPAGVQLIDLHGDLGPLGRLPSAVVLMHIKDDDARLTLLEERGVPVVLIGHHQQHSWVAPDDRAGAELATRQLTEAGHRQLMFLGAGESQVARDREDGFRTAAREVDAAVATLPGGFTALDGYRTLRRAWEQGLRFTGCFAASDEQAVGAVAALQDLGLDVPGQVSVVGFDGLPELPLPVPLTTVSQDIDRIAEVALRLVQEALSGEPPRGEFVPVRLLPGHTVARPP
ncbi:LacI family transcriptional regulator [Deinococcus metalli]|uniref:LacI family transcriptional regulator n=1 Tax=Deinococcus metalli TaxID=1141878 RepID=A0A7W8KEG9_9DEIO|nr:LacI family DNA-binding transcriptional regulator [Deinococcus metalli]MBB5376697.1 LacI family transcriptional regulator [Deinococcus metalli]GHF65814.1 LacI family transcriptional regulator [Deinococcus metalli]